MEASVALATFQVLCNHTHCRKSSPGCLAGVTPQPRLSFPCGSLAVLCILLMVALGPGLVSPHPYPDGTLLARCLL